MLTEPNRGELEARNTMSAPPGLEAHVAAVDATQKNQNDPPPGLATVVNQNAFPGQPQFIPDSPRTSNVPGSMNAYERNWFFQLGLLLVLFAIAVTNTYINFQMIDIFEDLIIQLEKLPQPSDIEQATIDDMLQEFNSSNNDELCDIGFFAGGFVTDDLIGAVRTVQRIVKASTYITVGFGIWITFLIKMISAYSLVTEDFNVVATEDLMQSKRGSIMDKDGNRVSVSQQKKFDLIRTQAVAESLILESQGEKKIRVLLRSETILFGFNQVIQDIPQGTAAALYILFLIRERGVLCYNEFTNGVVSSIENIDQVNNIVLGQIAIILVSMFVNLVLNLAPRWVRYFHHQTVKHSKKPKSTSIRIFQVTAWVVGYFFAVLIPVFGILYSPLGNDLFGLNTTDSLLLLVLIVASSLALAIGLFFVCCFWGVQFGQQICVCLVVCEALDIGCEVCQIEACELLC